MSRIEEALRKAQTERRRSQADRRKTPRDPAPHGDALAQQDPTWSPAVSLRESELARIPEDHSIEVDERHLHEQRVIAALEEDERVGPYRQLRTQLLKAMRDNHWSNLAITSAHQSAGKSLTAANLAIALAKDVRTNVLLVDLDFTSPTVHRKLNLTVEKGLVDYLEGDAELEEILFDPGIDSLVVLAGRPAEKSSSELLDSPQMHELMRNLCQQDEANVTIFDLPPLLRNDDALLFSPYADATLFVIEEGVTTEDQLQRSLELLKKANVIGTILNKSRG